MQDQWAESWACSRKQHDLKGLYYADAAEAGGSEWAKLNASTRQEDDRVQESLRFQWQPSGCSIVPWDPVQLLRQLLGGRRLVLVGDSLTEQHCHSLHCSLNAAMIQLDTGIKRKIVWSSSSMGSIENMNGKLNTLYQRHPQLMKTTDLGGRHGTS